MIGVYATCEVKAEQKPAFEALVKKLIEESLTHKGVISYDCGELSAQPNHYCFIERWDSEESLNAHLQADFLKENGAKLKAMLVDGLKVTRLNLL